MGAQSSHLFSACVVSLVLPRTALAANVADVVCGGGACAARKTDGSAVVWGFSGYGGDASGVDLAGDGFPPPSSLPSPRLWRQGPSS